MSVNLTTLPNGLRVVSETRRSVETVSVGVWVDVGARHESAEQNGLTHFLEHMLFKGTKTRSAKQIAFEIEAVGGHMNAYTSRDHTTYYARVMKNDTGLAVGLLADLLLNSVFDPDEIEREKDVVLQEIGQTLDTPDDVVFDNLQAVAFKDQAIGRTILGPAENVRAFSRDGLIAFLKSNYLAETMVVSAVGNLEHDELVGHVERSFSGLSADQRPRPSKAKYIGGKSIETRDLEQAHLTLGWEGVSYNSERYYAFQLYSMILGGGMSSRLFQRVREELGLAYSVYSFASSHADAGLFGIYAGTGPETLGALIPVIQDEMAALVNGPEELEFNAARAQMKSGVLMALEATTSRMEQLGRQLLMFDRVIPTSEITENIEAVGLEDVTKVAETLANAAEYSMALIGSEQAVLQLER